RIISDHLRAAAAMLQAGVDPSNKLQGYILRRLIRRSAVKMHELKGELIPEDFPERFRGEIAKFKNTLDRGLKEFNKFKDDQFNALNAFNLFQTYGFPFEVTAELFKQKGHLLDKKEFDQVFSGHQKLSRTASAGMFKAGLADHSVIVTKLHTATHLLHAALRQVLGSHVRQEGSNITSERLRFDFSHPQALTLAEISQAEALMNQKIQEDLPVVKTILDKKTALQSGALAFFKETYPHKVSVYTIGNFSKELCGGPHVDSTAKIGSVKIIKQESIGAGKRRLYAVLNHGTQKPAHQA
ncbi:MAG: alanine--tRNA ligase-related protein, partial [Patescibacteria group bacterium]|nr:alanine--tRNA ligase-related protein [Patescibacteria group bacterium]